MKRTGKTEQWVVVVERWEKGWEDRKGMQSTWEIGFTSELSCLLCYWCGWLHQDQDKTFERKKKRKSPDI